MPSLLQRLAVDITPLRASRDLRLLVLGNVVSGLGTQAALVALPYQIYVETGSAFLTGLLGAVELVPLVAMALLGGAIADRRDRRRILLLDQIALVVTAAALAALAFGGSPPIPLLYVLGGLPPASARSRTSRARRSCRTSSSRAAALGARAQLRALPADDGRRPGGRRPADRRARRGRRLRGRRRELPGDGRGRRDDAPAAAAGRRPAGRRRAPLDRRGPALRARQPGADGLVRDRPDGDDVRHAAGAVRRALGQRLPRGRRAAPACSTPPSRSARPSRR